MQKIAVYGSLKQGAYNHSRFDIGKPVGYGTVVGAMYLMASYPHLFREGVKPTDLERTHEVEIYEIEDDVYESIYYMELGAGYQCVDENIDGHDVKVFYSNDDLKYFQNWIEGYSAETVPQAFNRVIEV